MLLFSGALGGLLFRIGCLWFNWYAGGYREAVYETISANSLESPNVINGSRDPNPYAAPQTMTGAKILIEREQGVPVPTYAKATGIFLSAFSSYFVLAFLLIEVAGRYSTTGSSGITLQLDPTVPLVLLLCVPFFVLAGTSCVFLPTTLRRSLAVSALCLLMFVGLMLAIGSAIFVASMSLA